MKFRRQIHESGHEKKGKLTKRKKIDENEVTPKRAGVQLNLKLESKKPINIEKIGKT